MHGRFCYKNPEDLVLKARELGYELPYTEDLSPLLKPLTLDGFSIPNRFVVQPMEGYDSSDDGSPSDLTERRYLRYAEGGSGIIWFEAVAVTGEGRSNKHQLWIHDPNLNNYSRLVTRVRKAADNKGNRPLLVVQLTHSGRYSKPDGRPKPLVAALNSILDKAEPYILSDDDLEKIQDRFIDAAKLARDAGFDAIDLKACHGYLIAELLSARNRVNSRYGGIDPGNRFRFLLQTIERIRTEVPDLLVTTRLNISDCYSGGFGVDDKDNPDFTEPLFLVEELLKRDIKVVNISMGSPHYNPHVTRPFDTPLPGKKVPQEHPVEGVMRMITGTAIFQKRFPEVRFIGSAYSWLRQYAPNVGAAVLADDGASFIGFGRGSFAYPSMPADIIRNGKADPAKVCISCSGCTRLISNQRPGGCVIRDKQIYGAELKKLIADGK